MLYTFTVRLYSLPANVSAHLEVSVLADSRADAYRIVEDYVLHTLRISYFAIE